MSRPRKPFGANHPGRLPATVMKILAAEMSDPSRLRRGKQYAKDGSVLDIIIDRGVVTCEIQGSRSTPYVASVEVTFGDGMPQRRDISTSCTCPDDDNWDGYACKHVVATLFVLSDEFLLDPDLLDLWRGRPTEQHDASVDEDDDDDEGEGVDDPTEQRDAGRRRRHLHLVRSGESAESNESGQRLWATREPDVDPLADLLRPPDGAELPEVGTIDRIEPQLPRSRELASVLRDALGNLRIEWD